MPRAFKKTLPGSIYYKTNKTAWMTGVIFSKYVPKFIEAMRVLGQNIVLLLDNVTCCFNMMLFNTKLIFLPTNTTVSTQPLDAGIIKNFKLKTDNCSLSIFCTKWTQVMLETPRFGETNEHKKGMDWLVWAW